MNVGKHLYRLRESRYLSQLRLSVKAVSATRNRLFVFQDTARRVSQRR